MAMIPYDGQLRNHKYSTEVVRSKKKGKVLYTTYCNSIITFDIEVTSGWIENGKVIPYRTGMSAEDYWNTLTPVALPYIWQCSCDGVVYYGRELRDFIHALEDIPNNMKCIIWVHNLAYEFAHLQGLLTWESVFARSAHKPMKAVPERFPNIEFRCSYMLTRLSLASWGEQLGVLKATGDLDYEVLRTPLTPLTDTEMNYCERDCLVLEAGIKDYLKRYGSLRKIPLTQTGTVRLEVKDRLMCNPKYVSKIKKLVPKDAEEYSMLQEIFAGGYTHANYWYAGQVMKGYIEHYDFASSYPTVMVCEKYPMSPWVYTGMHEIPKETRFEDYAYIMRISFRRLNSISMNTYIQASKCTCKNATYDNGRIMSADYLEMYVTEQDWITIKNNYKWEGRVKVHEVYESRKDYLPKEFVQYILELYANKTMLKDVAGKEDIYMQSKQYINSLFGMMVTAICQADVKLIGDKWIVDSLNSKVVNKRLTELKVPNPRDKRYFLSYSWGCWVTAYARRNLWKCIEECDDELLYCDTDSIFVLDKHDFSWYNEEVTEKLRVACEAQGLDFELTHPKTPKGKEKPLGYFAPEDPCSEFITLGAKRYVERRIKDGKLHLTVSGINKEAVALLNDDIENFRHEFNFDKDADCVTKKLHTYLTDMPVVTYPDGYVSTYTHGVNMRRTGYELSIDENYMELINYMDKTIDDLPEQVLISMRGRF